MENKEFASFIFLDFSFALKFGYKRLIYKLETYFPSNHCFLLHSYLTDRTFYIQVGTAVFQLTSIDQGWCCTREYIRTNFLPALHYEMDITKFLSGPVTRQLN